jgi:hypothetical protein
MGRNDVVKIGDAQNSAKEVLSFVASHSFTTTKLLMMESIRDKLINVGVAHLTQQNNVILGAFCCLV